MHKFGIPELPNIVRIDERDRAGHYLYGQLTWTKIRSEVTVAVRVAVSGLTQLVALVDRIR